MWKEMARIIGEVRPTYAFVENSPMLTTRGLGTVLADLASMGFDAEWGVLSAADVGAPHRRDRIWILGRNSERKLAYANSEHGKRWRESQQSPSYSRQAWNQSIWCSDEVCDTSSQRQQRQGESIKPMCATQDEDWKANIIKSIGERSQWQVEPNVGRVADRVAFAMDRLKAIGNGQVPLCAATAFQLLRARIEA